MKKAGWWKGWVEKSTTTSDMKLYWIICCFVLPGWTFNLEPRIAILKEGPANTYFGFSVSQHQVCEKSLTDCWQIEKAIHFHSIAFDTQRHVDISVTDRRSIGFNKKSCYKQKKKNNWKCKQLIHLKSVLIWLVDILSFLIFWPNFT